VRPTATQRRPPPRRLLTEVTVGLLDSVAPQALIATAEDVNAAVYLQQQQRQLPFLGLGIQAGRHPSLVNGSNSGTPKPLKSATLRVTTVS
jgi:hypothetical protein